MQEIFLKFHNLQEISRTIKYNLEKLKVLERKLAKVVALARKALLWYLIGIQRRNEV